MLAARQQADKVVSDARTKAASIIAGAGSDAERLAKERISTIEAETAATIESIGQDGAVEVEALKKTRNRLAEELGLQPGVLCPNGTLEAIARVQPEDVAGLAAIEEVRRWQAAAIGEALLATLHTLPESGPNQ